MAYISEKLLRKFPDFKQGDWELYNNGIDGTKIIWNRPEPAPTIEDIDGYYPDALIEQERPGPEAALTRNPTNNVLLKVIAELTNTPYAQVISKLKTYIANGN